MPYPYVLTETFSVCKECDKDVDVLDVPEEACDHTRETHGKAVALDFVPRRDYDTALELIRDLVEHEDTSIARGRALLGLDS